MREYNPLEAPNPEEWRCVNEGEQIHIIEAYHKRARIKLPNRRIHAVFHAIVETQIADDSLPVRKVLDRLMSEGLDRHEAIHAIARVLSSHVYDMMQGEVAGDPNPAYFKELEELTAEKWRTGDEQSP